MPLLREVIHLIAVPRKSPQKLPPEQAQMDERAPKKPGLPLQTLPYWVWKPTVKVEPRAEMLEQPRGNQTTENDEEADQITQSGVEKRN